MFGGGGGLLNNPFFDGGHGPPGGPGGLGGGTFKAKYRCYSLSMMAESKETAEQGGKIFLPASALDQLTRLHVSYPMLFKLTNASASRTTHCGVLEFSAGEGKVHLPYWMMQNLMIEEGGLLQVESATLPVATFAKFQPHSVDFLDLTNPKAVLESCLRNFACLSTDDVIAIIYNGKTFEISVLETKPAKAVTVIECDLNVDFAAPVGYKEPDYKGAQAKGAAGGDDDEEEEHLDVAEMMPEPKGFIAFSGMSSRLDGKKKRTSSECDAAAASNAAAAAGNAAAEYVRGIPDYDFEVGALRFIRGRPKKAANGSGAGDDDGDDSNGFEAFKGAGKSLRGQ